MKYVWRNKTIYNKYKYNALYVEHTMCVKEKFCRMYLQKCIYFET